MTEQSPDSRPPLSADLQAWLAAGLISAEQAQAIRVFEADRVQMNKQGRATRAIALLGGLTVASGVGSLVAYNWDKFGDGVKLAAMGVLLMLSSLSTFRARQRLGQSSSAQPSAALDTGLLVTMGLTLAGLALISQVYDQDGQLWVLLFYWSALTSPLMSFARTRFSHYVWYAALFFCLMSSGDALDDFLRDAVGLRHGVAEMSVILLFTAMTGSLAARFAASRHPGRVVVGLHLYQLHLIVLGLFGGLMWLEGGDGHPLLWLIGVGTTGALLVATPESVERLGWGKRPAVLGLVGAGSLLFVLPMGLPVDHGFLAFGAFVLFWGLAWYLAERAGFSKNARLAVGVLGVRIVIASFELFESLLVTGTVLTALGGAALFWSKLKWSPTNTGSASHD